MADDGGAAAVPGESAGYIPEDTNTLVLYSGMTSSGEKLSKGDTLQVFSGGTAILTTVNNGGILQLLDGG